MIPREEHIKQINRFHDIFEKVDKRLLEIKDSKEHEDEKFLLLHQYFILTSRIWCIIDDSIKNESDKFETFNWEHNMFNY